MLVLHQTIDGIVMSLMDINGYLMDIICIMSLMDINRVSSLTAVYEYNF